MKKNIYAFSILIGISFFILKCSPDPISPKKIHEIIPLKGTSPIPLVERLSYKSTKSSNDNVRAKETYSINMNIIEPVLKQAQVQTGNTFVAVFSVKDSIDNRYSYYIESLKFSEKAVRESNGEVEPYFFEATDTKDEVQRIAMAYIPKSILARQEMDDWIIPEPKSGAVFKQQKFKKKLAIERLSSTEMCFIEDTRYYIVNADGEVLYMIVVGHEEPCATATPPGDGGGQGTGGCNWDWPRGDDTIDDEHCPFDCGGGGSELPPPPPPNPCEEENPPVWCTNKCETGDEIIDNTGVQETFEYLIDESNMDLPIEQRTEKGGFITENPLTRELGFTEFPNEWSTFSCGINPPTNWLDSVPANTIAYVHTHPFSEGEDTTHPNVCGSDGIENYQSGTNIFDIDALSEIQNYLSNFSIKGYIIDGNNIVTYGTLPGSYEEVERCGY